MKTLLVLLITLLSIHTYAKTLVIVGDSLTEGYGVAKEKAFPALIDEKIKSDNKDWKVVNSGVSGSTTASAPSRIKWLIKGSPAKSKPDLVMIALGANDGLRGVKVATSKKNLDEAMALLKKENIPMVIGGMHMPPNFGKTYTKEFSAMFVDLSKKYDAVLIPFILDKVAGDIKLNQTDGIHPNEEGHKIMADTIYNQIKTLLN